MQHFLVNAIKYPENAIYNREQGRVYISFVVNKDGSLEQITLKKGVSPDLNEEALRVVKIMPNWEPAIYEGEKVRARATIPINFVLVDGIEGETE